MGLARRQFLRGILASCAGWQVCSWQQMAWAADQYGQKLSKSTNRKLALLIGINQYNAKGEWLPLNGCVTDVELQRELLIHRFGFHESDIVTLTDQQATRQGIGQAFTEHLIGQALPEDVVVVHFSGHGSHLGDRHTLVPIDSPIPLGNTVNDIMEETLLLWLQAIGTDNITCVLDTGYNYPGTPIVGNFRVRARPSKRDWQPSPEELELQQQLTEQLEGRKVTGAPKGGILIPHPPRFQPRLPQAGVLLQAAGDNQLCADALWQGFSSGVFTYALTQQLWQMTPATSLYVVLGNVVDTLEQQAFRSQHVNLVNQIKEHINGANFAKDKQQITPSYFDYVNTSASKVEGLDRQSADGIITAIGNNRKMGEAWLGGSPIHTLGYHATGSILEILPEDKTNLLDGNDRQLVQVRSQNGMTAKIEPLTANSILKVGQLLRERVRSLPRSLGLAIALDLGLNKIERVDATSAISALAHMTGLNAAEQFADCLFGTQSASYGLFSVGQTPIIGSFGAAGESVSAAIRRLETQMQGLLAAKLIRLTENQASSCLALKATITAITANSEQPVVLASKITQRSDAFASDNSGQKMAQNRDRNATQVMNVIERSLAVGDRLFCHLENLTNQPLYVRIFSFDPRAKMMSPCFVASPYASDNVIPAQQTLVIPQPNSPFTWTVAAPKGLVDVQIVVSRLPMPQTSSLLDSLARQAASPAGMMAIPKPLDVAQALLSDLCQAEHVAMSSGHEDLWMLDVEKWATLRFTYHVA